MSGITKENLRYYNKNAQSYFKETVDLDMSRIWENVDIFVPPGAKILDLGCGSGRDSVALRKRGHFVTAVDGSPVMVELATQYTGQTVLCQTFEKLRFPPESFDLIWASASLLHLQPYKLKYFLKRSAAWLNETGFYYLSFKYGGFGGERDGRFYTDMNEFKLQLLMEKVKVLKIINTWHSKDARLCNDTVWLNVILKKVVTTIK